MRRRPQDSDDTTEHSVAKPELGTKRFCAACNAKFYDLNRDPIICPTCNATFSTGTVIAAKETANEEENDELENDDENVELVALEEADGDAGKDDDDDDDDDAVTVNVDADDDALIDDDDDDESGVSDVVRPTDDEDDT